MSRKKKAPSSRVAWLVAGALVLVAGALLYVYGGRYWYDHRTPNFKAKSVVDVYPGTTADSLLSIVKPLAKDPASVERAFRSEGLTGAVKPGRYVIDPTVTSVYAARMFAHGWESDISLTIAPTFRFKSGLADQLGRQLMIGREPIAAALNDPAFLSRFGMDTLTVLTAFIPDTYSIKWSVSLNDLFGRIKTEYDAYWNEERRAAAAAQELTPTEVAILASIVHEETKNVPEMPTIAGVYLNRLHTKGWKLEADPTLNYLQGYRESHLYDRHKRVDSPYNTYMYPGLPPGPISCSPKECLEAVLHPEVHKYYFFCASPDNFHLSEKDRHHNFAATGAEHSRNAAAFQAAQRRYEQSKK